MSDARPPAFHPVNALERQLVAAANGDRAMQKAFERAIPDAQLYVATPEPLGDGGEMVLEAAQTLQLLNAPLDDGRAAPAIFTSPQRIWEAFGEGYGYVAMEGRALLEIVRGQPALLNPGQAYGVLWEPASLSAMIGLPVERVVVKDTQVMLGAPAEPPVELIAALKRAFEPLPEVEAAWLALAYWPEEGTHAWHLDVRSAGDREGPRRALAGAIEGLQDGKPLDMVVNPPGGEDGVGLVVVERKAATPEKKPGGWLARLRGR